MDTKQGPNNRTRPANKRLQIPPANNVHSLRWHIFSPPFSIPQLPSKHICAFTNTRRNALTLRSLPRLGFSDPTPATSKPTISDFVELPGSGGVLQVGEGGDASDDGEKVAIHYYGRLAAKQGWRRDSNYDHKDANGEPVPFEFVLGSGKVISGVESAARSMKVGGIRRYPAISRISRHVQRTRSVECM